MQIFDFFLLQEQPFVGSLVSIFPDGSQRERQVEAVIQVQHASKDQLMSSWGEKALFRITLFPFDSESYQQKHNFAFDTVSD